MLLLLIALTLTGATTLIAQPTSSASQGHVEEVLTLEAGGSLIEGYVDWTKNELVVYGDATVPEHISNPVQRRLLGFRGAKAVAYRNLLEMIGEVQIDSETRVQNFIVTSDSIGAKVQGLVRGARIITGSQVENEGLYRIALRLPLLGEVADAVLPEVARLAPDAYDIALPVPPEPMANSLDSSEDIMEEEAVVFIPRVPYTGILVDARGLARDECVRVGRSHLIIIPRDAPLCMCRVHIAEQFCDTVSNVERNARDRLLVCGKTRSLDSHV